MKNKQYIFCLETTNKAQTDWLYIKKLIDYLNQDKQVFDKYTPLYMKGKGNYNKESFIYKLKTTIKKYNGESVIIYCIDLDDYHVNIETKRFVENVEKYCNENKYKFAYFSRDIEEVFWGKQISKDKEKFAARFNRNIAISKDLINKLNVETKAIGTSNIYCLLKNLMNQLIDRK